MRQLLLPFGLVFRTAVWVRNKLYNSNLIKTKDLSCKTISVGNVSSGGTGKTPMVGFLAKYFIDRGKSVAVILKGYKRKYDDMQVTEFGYENKEGKLNIENFGDEALMLLENLSLTESGKGLLITSDNKITGAKFADNKFNPEIIIIDDGFQLRKLHRDLDIVMVNPYDSRHLLPAGNYREPLKNIKRADTVILNHKFRKEINLLHKRNFINALDCRYELINFINYENKVLNSSLNKAIVFCGIGEPDSFRQLFEYTDINILEFITFPDHHIFSENDLKKIISVFKDKNADCILTTQKDFVRIKYPQKSPDGDKILANDLLTNYPLYYANIKLQILQNENKLIEKLEKIIKEIQ